MGQRKHRLWLGREWKFVEIGYLLRLHLKPDKSMLLK